MNFNFNPPNAQEPANRDAAIIACAHTDAIRVIRASLLGDADAVCEVLTTTPDHLEFVGALLAMTATFARLFEADALESQLQQWEFAAAVETYSETGQ